LTHTVNQPMVCRKRAGSAAFWAWTVSAAVHLLIFAVCAAVEFGRRQPADKPRPLPTAGINQIRRSVRQPVVMPKPAVKTFREKRFTAKSLKMLPPTNPIKASEDLRDFVKPADLRPEFSSAGMVTPKGIEFFGSRTDSRKICYLVDCSGSMCGVFGMVQKKLKASLASLQPDQYFSVVFFGDNRLFEFGSGQLVRATDQSKLNAFAFIDSIRPAGRTNAAQALKRAVEICNKTKKHSSVIYFLTDGFELTEKNSQYFTSTIARLLDDFTPETKINTIGFWPVGNDRRILETIAAQSGGECVLITDDEN